MPTEFPDYKPPLSGGTAIEGGYLKLFLGEMHSGLSPVTEQTV